MQMSGRGTGKRAMSLSSYEMNQEMVGVKE